MPSLILHRLADIAPATWDALLPEPQPFLRHAFLSALEDSGSVGGRSGWRPSHRLLRAADGSLLAADDARWAGNLAADIDQLLLRQLGQARAASIKDYLVERGGLEDQRIYLLDANLRGQDQAGGRVATSLHLGSL